MSRIGKKPVQILSGVKVEVHDGTITVEGPKGKLVRAVSDRMKVEVKDNQIIVTRPVDTKLDRSLHGLTRALIANMVKGVTDGFTRELEIQGVGFKAVVASGKLNLQLSYSHPVSFSIPEGIKIETPKPTQIVVRGIDKEKVGEVAAEIRGIMPPEPYKGKGIRYAGERVKKKVGKAQATGK